MGTEQGPGLGSAQTPLLPVCYALSTPRVAAPRHACAHLRKEVAFDSRVDFARLLANIPPYLTCLPKISHTPRQFRITTCSSSPIIAIRQPGAPLCCDRLSRTTSSPTSPNMAQMPAEERVALIKENLAESLDFDMIENIINQGKDPKVYWGTYVTIESPAPSWTTPLAPRPDALLHCVP